MSQTSSVFVRKSTGLVREASFVDAAIFTACFSAPVGATLAFGIFWALSTFPGSNVTVATLLAGLLDVPILIMMALMASSMPRTGGDYIWVSRILSPPVAMVSNFAAALSALIGASYWARIWAPQTVGPALAIMGHVLHIQALIDMGEAAGNNWWTFGLGFFMIAVLVVTLGLGTKKMFKVQNTFFIIAMIGTLATLVVFLVGKQATFVSNFNSFAGQYTPAGANGNPYQWIIDQAAPHLTSNGFWGATVPTIVCIMTFMVWNFWSVYLSGEMKSAGQRNRQLGIMMAALLFDVVFIVVGILLIDRAVGAQFLSSINWWSSDPSYGLPVQPYFNFFAGMIANNPLLNILIGVTFLFWNLPAMVGNTFMPIRALFSWSFDRVLPAKLSDVNEKTHSPLPAIGVVAVLVIGIFTWSILSTSFFTLLSLGVLCGVVLICIVGVAAIVMPYRRKELYKTSPANVNIGKVPWLVILGVLSILVMLFITYLLWVNPVIGIEHWWYIPIFFAGIAVVGLAIYYIAYYVQKSRGIDISLAYKELPPE